MDHESLRGAVGWNAGRYLRHAERMRAAGKRWLPGWNWAAFLHSTGWFWYRRMYGWSVLNLLAPVLLLMLLVFAVQWFVPPERMGTLLASMGIAYAALVYGLLPVFADSLYLSGAGRAGAPPRPPSLFTAFGALLIIVVPACMAYTAAMAQREYQHRERVSEGLSAAVSLRAAVNEYYAENRRLPGPQEAAQFLGRDPLKFTASVGWDPARRAIVVTMGEDEDGRRFETPATEKDGALVWTCRTIDLDAQYLPASCR